MKNPPKDTTIIVEIFCEGTKFIAREIKSGMFVSDKIPYSAKRLALKNENYLYKQITAAGNILWRNFPKSEGVPNNYVSPFNKDGIIKVENVNVNNYDMTDNEVAVFVKNCISLKPTELILDDLTWKMGIRAAIRGDNILITGYSGFGKTMTAKSIKDALKRPYFYFNMGAMQDAKSSLIGNTHFKDGEGTIFHKSEFITAITTPGAVILLDELTRMTEDAENIILSVLDRDQRCIRLDDDPKTPTIIVSPGVTFIATANYGVEYTSTRIIDRATKDRFSAILEVPVLTYADEIKLLCYKYKTINKKLIKGIAKVAEHTRQGYKDGSSDFSTMISARQTVEMIGLIRDGFLYTEVIKIISNQFDEEGGPESERAKLLAFAQADANLDNEPIYKGQSKYEIAVDFGELTTDETTITTFSNNDEF